MVDVDLGKGGYELKEFQLKYDVKFEFYGEIFRYYDRVQVMKLEVVQV